MVSNLQELALNFDDYDDDMLARYTQHIISALDDYDSNVRMLAMEVLDRVGSWKPHMLASYAKYITPVLDDKNVNMRSNLSDHMLQTTLRRPQHGVQ